MPLEVVVSRDLASWGGREEKRRLEKRRTLNLGGFSEPSE
jgi:hypothetical protein